jgi:uncharacterized protein YqeY
MISETLNGKIAQALKSKDEVRVSTLRLLASALNYEKIDKQHELSEEEELVVVKSEAKKRKDAIAIYKKVGAKDKADKEEQELTILKEFLPEDLSDDKLAEVIDESIAELGVKEVADMGKVMGVIMKKVGGKADGKRVAELVRKRLSD